jgi:peptidoglycan/xylan/chitin deacetylase (PgdA/CDA1 family)
MNIPILLYHSVSVQTDGIDDQWSVSPENFEIHLSYLREQGYQPLTVDEIADAIRSKSGLPDKPVAITFDDGLEDFLTHAVPVLQKYDFPSTLFVTTGFVGGASHWAKREDEKTRPMLSWQELASLQGKINIGAHSHNHPHLDLIPLKQAREEVAVSKKMLEYQLGIPIATFAFPHGYYSHRVISALKDAGYTSACIVGHAMATDSDNLYALPRIIIKSDDTSDKLEQYLQGIGLNNRNFWHGFRRKGWWFVRKVRGGYILGIRRLLRIRNRRSIDRKSNM